MLQFLEIPKDAQRRRGVLGCRRGRTKPPPERCPALPAAAAHAAEEQVRVEKVGDGVLKTCKRDAGRGRATVGCGVGARPWEQGRERQGYGSAEAVHGGGARRYGSHRRTARTGSQRSSPQRMRTGPAAGPAADPLRSEARQGRCDRDHPSRPPTTSMRRPSCKPAERPGRRSAHAAATAGCRCCSIPRTRASWTACCSFLHHDLVRSATDWAHDVKRRRAAGIDARCCRQYVLRPAGKRAKQRWTHGVVKEERAGRMAHRHRAGTYVDCFKTAPHSLHEPIGSCQHTSRAKSSRRSFPHPPSRSNTGKSPRQLRTSLRRRATRPALYMCDC